MHMLGLVITSLRQKVTSLICNARELVIKKLSGLLGALTTIKTQLVTFLILPLNQVAQTLSTIKASLANRTTQASSTKAEPKHAVTTSGQTGKQQATTAPKTRRRATKASKKGN
jgi:hypothetical protein